MRVRNNSSASMPAGAPPAAGNGPVAGLPAAHTAKVTARPGDAATIMGIPEAELSPKVRAALDGLLVEVQSLRGDLDRARRRIGYLEEFADRDALAPVLNRRAFVRELARMIAFAERYQAPGSVLYFDIDGMKQINDTHGHGAGDAALKQVAEVLTRDVRASDVVGRLGGDEFGVILAQAAPEAAAAKAASLARAVESEPAEWNGARLDVGVSYGAYTYAGGEAVEDALDAADQAMYAQKRGHAATGTDA